MLDRLQLPPACQRLGKPFARSNHCLGLNNRQQLK
jgi:hypothetical protein